MERKKAKSEFYSSFQCLNGDHPLKKKTLNSFIEYRVRTRPGGRVRFFHFDLAKELGLLPKGHEEKLNEDLEGVILETFGLVIINEFDKIHNKTFPKKDIRPHKYMATRYLQLQHPNKQGKTSGDGRSIWNGSIKHGGVRYDVSSCGTGATGLSPATAIRQQFFETGDPTVSYGCGYSEIDEGLATAFFSEVFHKNHISTERVLAIIEYEDALAITVRVGPNLLRPGHMFNHLKQGHYEALKAMVNYHIDRQESNGFWSDAPKGEHDRYRYFLEKQTLIFANMACRYEDNYIFVWMDWDGDNILMDGGIIDYGSVRQFGLFHSEYRFDDGPRYSTTILEQKHKAKYTVQTFAQIVDYLISKKKKSIKRFSSHPSLKNFEKYFSKKKLENVLYAIGHTREQSTHLLKHHPSLVEAFLKDFRYFEIAKSLKGTVKVPDGINWNAIFCMRDILRELPYLYLEEYRPISCERFIDIIRSSYAKKEDLKLTTYRRKKIKSFQKNYCHLLDSTAKWEKKTPQEVLSTLIERSSIINQYDRVTGDSITTVVDKLLAKRKKLSPDDIYKILKDFVEYQNLDPHKKDLFHLNKKSRSMREIVKIVEDYREGL